MRRATDRRLGRYLSGHSIRHPTNSASLVPLPPHEFRRRLTSRILQRYRHAKPTTVAVRAIWVLTMTRRIRNFAKRCDWHAAARAEALDDAFSLIAGRAEARGDVILAHDRLSPARRQRSARSAFSYRIITWAYLKTHRRLGSKFLRTKHR